MMMNLRHIAAVLGGEVSGNSVRCPAPGHSAKDRGMTITFDDNAPDGFIVNLFNGGDPLEAKDYVRSKLGMPSWQPGKGNGKVDPANHANAKAKRRIVATYDYVNENGERLFQVVRYEPKDFRQRRPDGKGGWIWSTKGVRRVPYRLPEMLAAEHDDVIIVEGEKDVDNLAKLGFVATCNAGGAGKWAPELAQHFKDRDVFIIGDNDQPGAQHVAQVNAALAPVANSVRIVQLPVKFKDVSNWIEADGTRDEMGQLLEAATEAPPIAPEMPAPRSPLRWLDMSTWDHVPVPEREWAIRDRVPLRQAGLFSGEGGTGKSIIELMKNVAHVAGKDWFGSMPEPGPAFYVGAEDDERELHIRLAVIAKHYDVTFTELIEGGLHVLPLLNEDATLCAQTKSGKIEPTALYHQLYEAAGDIKPINISIDTLSHAFAGNEIDRGQVYAFYRHMRTLAQVAEGALTVLSHPSLQGINSGSGISGSTAWHGAFRFRHYLKGVKADAGEQPDDDLRELEFKKNQYGPRGSTVVVRYQHGIFLSEGGIGDLDKLAKAAKAQEVFLDLLRRFVGQNRNVSDRKNANNYAPTAFAHEDEAKKHRLKKDDLAEAMRQLFKADKIHNEVYGKSTQPCSKIEIGPAAEPGQ
jgi:RecA-family ATPase